MDTEIKSTYKNTYETAEKQLREYGKDSGKYYEISDFVKDRTYGIGITIYDCTKEDVDQARALGDESFREFGRKVKILEKKGLLLCEELQWIDLM